MNWKKLGKAMVTPFYEVYEKLAKGFNARNVSLVLKLAFVVCWIFGIPVAVIVCIEDPTARITYFWEPFLAPVFFFGWMLYWVYVLIVYLGENGEQDVK